MAVPRCASLPLPGTKTTVHIEVRDLLDFNGHKVIPVNEFFDSALGSNVNASTLHGQCIQRLFNGSQAAFDTAVATALSSSKPRSTAQRPLGGKVVQYNIGTVAVVSHGPSKLFLTALSRTDVSTNKAHADIHDLISAWTATWKAIRVETSGEPVAVPLMGAGQSGVGLSYPDLLRTLLMTLAHEAREREIGKQVHVLLSEEAFDAIDLKYIRTGMEA